MARGTGGIFDSGKYRQPTEAEAAEVAALLDTISRALRDDDTVNRERAEARLRKALAALERGQ